MAKVRQGGFLMSKIRQLSGRIFTRMLKSRAIEITPAQGRILFPLWLKDDIPIQELAAKTGLGKSTLTRMLDRLENSGHLVRVFTSSDRRKVLIRLTEENKRMKAAYERVSIDMADLYYTGFSEDEIDQFEGYLERILENLSAVEGKPRHADQ